MRGVIACTIVTFACGRIGFAPIASDASGATSFCASLVPAPTFCDDFDDPATALAWTQTGTQNGTYAVDTTEALSAPASLRVDIASIAASTDFGDVELDELSLGTAAHAHAGWDLFVDTVGMNGAALFRLTMDDGAQLHTIEVAYVPPPTTSIVEDIVQPHGGAQTYNFFDLPVVSAGAWHRYELDFTAATVQAPARLVIAIDGATALDTPPAVTTGGAALVQLGIVYVNGVTTPWTVHLDNFYVDIQ